MKFSRWHRFQEWLFGLDHERCIPFDWEGFMAAQPTPEQLKAQFEAGGIPSRAFGDDRT